MPGFAHAFFWLGEGLRPWNWGTDFSPPSSRTRTKEARAWKRPALHGGDNFPETGGFRRVLGSPRNSVPPLSHARAKPGMCTPSEPIK